MEEYSNEYDQEQRPRWVPYTPPPPTGWERLRVFFRRLSFPFVVILFILGVGGAYYWNTQMQRGNASGPSIDVAPTIGESRTSGGGTSNRESQTRTGSEVFEGRAQLTVRSSPSGAAVRLNGDSIGTTPLSNHSLGSGIYMLSVQREGHLRSDTVVVLEDETSARFEFSLRPRSRPGEEPSASSATTASSQPSTQPATRSSAEASTSTSADPPSSSEPSAYGALRITSSPSGARVSIEGTERGRTPVSLPRVPLGTTLVTLSLDDHESWSREVDVQRNSTRQLHADLQPRTGRLRVLARPWGTIYINGDLHARERDIWYETQMTVGSHQVTVVHPALGQKAQEVQVRAGEETSIVVDLQSQASADTSP